MPTWVRRRGATLEGEGKSFTFINLVFFRYIKPGLVTNSILFCLLFKIEDQCNKVRFLQTHNQGLRQLLLAVS